MCGACQCKVDASLTWNPPADSGDATVPAAAGAAAPATVTPVPAALTV